jgi:hypothetical protein
MRFHNVKRRTVVAVSRLVRTEDFSVKPFIAASALLISLLAGIDRASAAPIKFLPPAEYTAVVVGSEGGHQIENNRDGTDGTTYPLYRPFTVETSGTLKAGGTDYTASAKLSLSNDHWGSVSASATTQSFSTGARGGMLYYFTVIGPDAAYVPVTVSGYGSAEADSRSGFAFASAEMRLNYLDGSTNALSSQLESFGKGQHHDFSDVINVKPNTDKATGAPSISLFAYAGAGSNDTPWGYYSGSASASIDPIISIADPKLAALYTIEIGLSDVVIVPPTQGGGVSPVPLPRSLPLFATALLSVCATGLWRRRTAAA